jgi:hypothetical protein
MVPLNEGRFESTLFGDRGVVARNIRLLSKKRGDRLTGSPLVGGLGEVLFFGILFLLGGTSLTYLIASRLLPAAQVMFQPGFGFWLMVLVTSSFTLIGGGGVIYTVLQIGTSAERRSAIVNKAGQIDLLGEGAGSSGDFPTIPRDTNITNSPGIRLAYRLPVAQGTVWALLIATASFLVCSGLATVLVTVAVRGHWKGRPDWFLSVLAIAMLGVAVWATYYVIYQLVRHTGIGPTTVEIARHPLYPGMNSELFVSQAGRLRMNELAVDLICQEETTFRQGTDIRTDHCRVHCQQVFSRQDFLVQPGKAFEHQCTVAVPPNVMHSFQANHNAVAWMLVVRVDAESWPVFERRFPVVVYPETGHRRTV